MKNLFTILLATLCAILLIFTLVTSCKKENKPNTISVYKSTLLGVGDIDVYVDGSLKGDIYDGQTSNNATCGNAQVNVTLNEAGTYTVKAIAVDGSEWERRISVTQDDCELINLTLSSRTKVPTPSVTTGQLVFWEDNISGCSDYTEVTINGVTKYISSFKSSEPDCSSSGTANFTLQAGSYAYSASCSGTIKTGTVSVTSNQCTPVKLDWGIIPPPPTGGQVVFWESLAGGCAVNTNVTINGVTKYITTYSSFAPDCGTQGNATFNLAQGTYSYVASCSGTTKTGTVTVVNGLCSTAQLVWATPGTTGKVVFWESSASGCAAATEVTINGVTKQITTFSSSAPSCDAAGNATFTLSPGTYSYVATCSGNTRTGTVTVVSNQCSGAQLQWNTQTTGQAMFWIQTDLGCGNITVNLGGIQRTITSYYNSAPACGTAGCATYTLAPGTYSFTASCNGKNWSGNVIVSNGGCYKLQLTD